MYYQHNWGPFWLLTAIILIIPYWRICQRIGWSPWLSLLMALPLVNVIFLYILAFADWPLQKRTAAPGST